MDLDWAHAEPPLSAVSSASLIEFVEALMVGAVLGATRFHIPIGMVQLGISFTCIPAGQAHHAAQERRR